MKFLMSPLLVTAALHVLFTLTTGQFSPTDAGTFPPGMYGESIPTRITIAGATHVTMTSQKPAYMGYVANVGDKVTISCRVNSTADQLEAQSLLDSESGTAPERHALTPTTDGRIVQVRDDKWVNTTINSLLMSDLARYYCVDDVKQLVVTNQYSPPKVVRHQCLSNGFNDLKCTFYTNCTRYDLVEWNVTWSTRENRKCDQRECRDIQCTSADSENQLSVSYITAVNRYQTVTCTIRGFLFVGVTYDFKVTGRIGKSDVTTVSTVSTPLNSSIIRLEPPEVVNSTTSASTINLRVKLNRTHIIENGNGISMAENGVQYGGHIEQAVNVTGLRYKLTYNDSGIKQVNMEVVYNVASTINITGLHPYSKYNVSVAYQMAETLNRNEWSQPRNIVVKTLETRPWVTPPHSSVGFSLRKKNRECGKDKREAVIYWKAVPDRMGYSNGKITSYVIYDINTATVMYQDGSTIYPDYRVMKTVNGDATSATLCLDHTLHSLGIGAINSAGGGPISATGNLIIFPDSQSVLELRECDFTVVADERNGVIKVEWDELDKGDDSELTIFYCKPDESMAESCVKDTLHWYTIPQNETNYKIPYDNKYLGYKFGLARRTADMMSSGVVWTRCISDLFIDLVAADLSVQLDSLNANVEISESCTPAHRVPDHYTLFYCQYNLDENKCSQSADSIDLSRCETNVEVVLDKHSQSYAFWITSHSGTTTSSSALTIKRTTARELQAWEIGLIVVVIILFVIAVCVTSVFIHKQLMKAKAYKAPQIIAPAQLAIEEERSDAESDSEFTDRKSLIDGYLTFRIPPTTQQMADSVEMVPATNFDAATRLLNDDWLNSGGGSLNYHELGARPRQRAPTYNNQPPATDDYQNQPACMDDSQAGGDYSKVTAPSVSSYRALPDDYLQCVGVEPEFNTSAGTYYDDTSSGNNIIDINKYLPKTSTVYTPTSKLTVDLESQYAGSPASMENYDDNKLCVDLPETCIPPLEADSGKGLRVDLPTASVSSDQTFASNTNTSSVYYPYTVLNREAERTEPTEMVEINHSDSDSYKSRGNSFSSSPGGTSGDSGYDGRNHSTTSSSRNNSLPKTKSDYKVADISDDVDDSLSSQ